VCCGSSGEQRQAAKKAATRKGQRGSQQRFTTGCMAARAICQPLLLFSLPLSASLSVCLSVCLSVSAAAVSVFFPAVPRRGKAPARNATQRNAEQQAATDRDTAGTRGDRGTTGRDTLAASALPYATVADHCELRAFLPCPHHPTQQKDTRLSGGEVHSQPSAPYTRWQRQQQQRMQKRQRQRRRR
jgi:hypothetical protein